MEMEGCSPGTGEKGSQGSRQISQLFSLSGANVWADMETLNPSPTIKLVPALYTGEKGNEVIPLCTYPPPVLTPAAAALELCGRREVGNVRALQPSRDLDGAAAQPLILPRERHQVGT